MSQIWVAYNPSSYSPSEEGIEETAAAIDYFTRVGNTE